MKGKWVKKLTPKNGTKLLRSKYPVRLFANSAQTFLNARISSRVTALEPPVIWNTYEKFSTTTPALVISDMSNKREKAIAYQ